MKSYRNVKNITTDESVNYSWVLNNQLDRISKAYTFGGIDQAIGGIENLRFLLSSFEKDDKPFKTVMKKIQNEIDHDKLKIAPHAPNKWAREENLSKQFYARMYPELLRLMDRHGLLGEKSGDYVPDDEDLNVIGHVNDEDDFGVDDEKK